jgi:hypothetical protein
VTRGDGPVNADNAPRWVTLPGYTAVRRSPSILVDVQFTARTVLPYLDEVRAVLGLRGELREQAAAHWQVPDWSTLEVTGPTEVVGASGPTWYRWATVTAKAYAAQRRG